MGRLAGVGGRHPKAMGAASSHPLDRKERALTRWGGKGGSYETILLSPGGGSLHVVKPSTYSVFGKTRGILVLPYPDVSLGGKWLP